MNTLRDYGIQQRDEQKYATKCPKCSDQRRKQNTSSLMVYNDDDGIRWECMHPGCEWFDNRQYLRTGGGSTKPAPLEFQLPIPPEAGTPPIAGGDNITVYTYKNQNGEALYYFLRIDEGGSKKFYYLSYTTSGEWVSKKPDVKTFYGIEDLKDDKKLVILVEGEKARDAAKNIFTSATVLSWPGGASTIKNGDWDKLRGRQVLIWPDNDEAGLSIARRIASKLDASVSIVDPSSLPRKADLADGLTTAQIERVWNTQELFRQPTVTGAGSVDLVLNKLKALKAGTSIGFENMKDLTMPRSGVIIIEGRSGHGKTSLLANILANRIRDGEYPVVFYSYELPTERIILKTVMILDGRELDTDPYKNEEAYREEILRGDNEVFNELSKKLGKEIFITDHYLNIDQLMADLSSPHMKGATVFIDYIQYIPAADKYTNRYLVIKSLSDKLQNIAHKQRLIVYMGAQLTPGDKPQLDSPREGKDIHNVAELVLRIWHKTYGSVMGVTRADLEDLPGNIVIEVRKNRNGFAGQKYAFNLVSGSKLDPVKLSEAF